MSGLAELNEQTGKTRVRRIPLDYHRTPGLAGRWRSLAFAIPIAAGAAYLLWVAATPGGEAHLSTGPLSLAHAALQSNCAACHESLTPIAGDAFRINPKASIELNANRCLVCHQTIYPHSERLSETGHLADRNCAACHQEHLGLTNRLIPINDRTCAECHGDVESLVAATRPEAAIASPSDIPPRAVVDFSRAGHGEFPSLASTAITPDAEPNIAGIRFDHAQHMAPGQVLPGRRGAMTLDRIPPVDRDRYRQPGQDDAAIVQLDCAACHTYTTGTTSAAARQWSKLSQPIRFDQHCAACHPLSAPGQREGQAGIPHGIPLSALRDELAARKVILDAEVDQGIRRGESPQPDPLPLAVPGKAETPGTKGQPTGPGTKGQPIGPGTKGQPIELDPETNVEIAPTKNPLDRFDPAITDALVQKVRDQCVVCHGKTDLEQQPRLPQLPEARLARGAFDHGAHRTAACVVCHPQADPTASSINDVAKPALATWLKRFESPALIQGIDSCTPCHQSGPNGLGAELVSGLRDSTRSLFGGLSDQAPDRCTTCHLYHGHHAQPTTPIEAIPLQTTGPASPIDDAASITPRPKAPELPITLTHAQRHRPDTATLLIRTLASETSDRLAPAPSVETAQTDRPDAVAFSNRDAQSDAHVGPWLGNASCAASTCHGGAIGNTTSWRSSVTTFDAYDPHTRAGRSLMTEASTRMIHTLDPLTAQSPQRYGEVLRLRCSGCHAPRAFDRTTESIDSTVSIREGVGCEGCHGPAATWIEPHLQHDFQPHGSMRDLNAFAARIEGCTLCHVGSRRADGLTRDMNHDLIAAGHPALRFDPWSALTRLPPHGNVATDDALPRIPGEAESRRYWLSRLIALRSAIELSRQRFEDSQTPTTNDEPAPPWPELAEHDCFGCHRSLDGNTNKLTISDGIPRPHAWLQAVLFEGGLGRHFEEDARIFNDSLRQMRLRGAAADEMKGAMNDAIRAIAAIEAQLCSPEPLPTSMAGLQDAPFDRFDWNAAAQWTLRGQAVLRDHPPQDAAAAIAALRSLHAALRLDDPQTDNPDVGQTDSQELGQTDSPSSFSPKAFQQAASALISLTPNSGDAP